MKTLKFKTNVKCQGCRSAITPYLDGEPSITSWQIDPADPGHILTVEGEAPRADKVIDLLKQAGFQGELIP